MAYWGLTLLPFENVVDKRFFYESEYHSEALLRLNYCTSSRKGAAVLIGDIGCGKTLINQLYIDSLPRDKYDVFFIPHLPSSLVD